MGADNTYGEEHFNNEMDIMELLTNLEHYQEKVAAMQDAIDGYKAALEETKGTLIMGIANATMNGKLILNPGKRPYIIAGYVVMIDYRRDVEGNGIILDMEVTEVRVIDVSLFKTIQL